MKAEFFIARQFGKTPFSLTLPVHDEDSAEALKDALYTNVFHASDVTYEMVSEQERSIGEMLGLDDSPCDLDRRA